MSSYVDEQIRKMWTSTQNYREPKNDTVQTERQKWIKAIKNIKAEIEKEKADAKNNSTAYYVYNEGLMDAHETDEQIIDKHTKELMK